VIIDTLENARCYLPLNKGFEKTGSEGTPPGPV
jgi:hypothetical protein